MIPYYDDEQIQIFHGDCRDVLPTLEAASVDLVLTDPPYGINLKWGGIGRTTKVREAVRGDDAPFDPSHLLAFGQCVLFGANNYAHLLPPSTGWLVWDKVTRNNIKSVLADAELIWTNAVPKVRVFRHMWNGAFRDSERGYSVHPTQKPVHLMRWILEQCTKPGDLVLDPYMGSGPVAQACHLLGRRYIGIEIEERYCEIAVQRLSQAVLPLGAD